MVNRLFEVTAVSVRPDTLAVSPPRVEIVNATTNQIFQWCSTPWDVEDQYEAFWNRLNLSWMNDWPSGKERVKVLAVRELVD